MSENYVDTPSPQNEPIVNTSSAKINYILYLTAILFGLLAVVGLVFAYTKRGPENPEWLNSHYNFQIATFWYGLVYLIVGALLSIVIIGWLIILFWVVWLIVRCVKGMNALDMAKPIEGGFFSFGKY